VRSSGANLVVFPTVEAVDVDALIREYDKRLTKELRLSTRRLKSDAQRIGGAFSRFRTQALAALPDRAVMNQAAIAGILERTSFQVQELVAELDPVYAEAMQFQATTAQRIAAEYADLFVAKPYPTILGTTPAALNLAMGFSADLIDVKHGGLGGKILQEVNQVLRLAALGAGPGGFNAAKEISAALYGPRFGATWTYQAERIYRTEVLRIQSLSTQASIDQLNRIQRTDKRWIWSGISRMDHRAAHNQTVSSKGRFSIAARAGVVKMRFPRDPLAPPDATVNCGCYVVPWPVGDRARRGRSTAKRPARKKLPPKVARAGQKSLSRTDLETGFQPAATLSEAQLQAARFAKRTGFGGADLVDEAAIRARLGGHYNESALKRYISSARRREANTWGGSVVSKQARLDALNLMNREFDRISALYPNIAPEAFGKLENSLITKSTGGKSHVTRPIAKTTMQVPVENWDSYGSAARHQDAHALRTIEWEKRMAKELKVKSDRVLTNIEPREHAIPQITRHEYGHALDGQLGIQADAEWKALMSKYDDEWWWTNVSEYSRHRSYGQREKYWESWAELFRMTTGPYYEKGTLPRDLERFVEKIIGAAL
jgi:hypothetical protein